MYHSITFGDKNTWTDWHLVATSRPVIDPPQPKTQYVDIPGADGSIDLTESLAGRPVFSDREGSLEFYVLNDFDIDGYSYDWFTVYSTVMQYLHGRYMRMVLEDDPNYYYEGRFSVNSWKSDQNHSTITIDYHVSPYRYLIVEDITASDLEVGRILPVYESGTTTLTGFSDESSDYFIRQKTVRPYTAGDSVRMGNKFRFDLALYGGTLENLTAKSWQASERMNGNRFTFTDDGFYRMNIWRGYNTVVTADDISEMVDAIYYYKGGIL